jgi:hypothetical protein
MADLHWSNNDFLITDGDLTMLQDSVFQELVFRFDTVKGTHFLNLNYGCNIHNRLGELNTIRTQMLATEDIEDALKQDPRIRNSSVKLVFIPTSVLTFDLTIDEKEKRVEVK